MKTLLLALFLAGCAHACPSHNPRYMNCMAPADVARELNTAL